MYRRPQHRKQRRLIARLDQAAREVNAVLLVLAIGLALLDGTCFFAFAVEQALPTTAARQASHPVVRQVRPQAASAAAETGAVGR